MRNILAATLVAMLSATAAHAAGAAPPHARFEGVQAGDLAVLAQVSTAKAEFDRHEYQQVVEALAPAMAPGVFDDLSSPMRYAVLTLYARSLFGLQDWADAHEAFITLTNTRQATAEDWMFRMQSAQKSGDAEDAAFAADHVQDDDDEAAPPVA